MQHQLALWRYVTDGKTAQYTHRFTVMNHMDRGYLVGAAHTAAAAMKHLLKFVDMNADGWFFEDADGSKFVLRIV